ncbi:MAG: toxin-antitoxin system HicB family antitoxin [Propionibacteriaceae bacterium]|jgi:predicted HicB family RNase H-like nuclease|nr:toxin-antitoxin system HicB family antitoxin [Propionibacteriaceae bacterium]
MSVAKHYTYRVHWSPEDEAHIGTVAELPSLSWISGNQTEAFLGICQLALDVVADMATAGETPPPALADREYSGKFLVRIPPESHRRLVVEAAEQNVSLNRLAASRLTR